LRSFGQFTYLGHILKLPSEEQWVTQRGSL
jgi:hypothetical protein